MAGEGGGDGGAAPAPKGDCPSEAALRDRVRDLEQQLAEAKARLQVAQSSGGATADNDVGSCGAATSPEVAKEVDFANYFVTYGFLYHQKEMLEDEVRMRSFYDAVMGNSACFEGKSVLDVGTGTGILAIWAAQAGARVVYAVEFTDMAKHAQKLVDANGLTDKIQIIRGSMEDLQLPEKVDIIISEWMGYFLMRESMLDSVLVARDRWLKPGGALYPSHATMMLGALPCSHSLKQHELFENTMDEWKDFVDHTREAYGVDMSILTDAWTYEHREYFMEGANYVNAPRTCLLSKPAALSTLDLNTMSLGDAKGVNSDFRLDLVHSAASAGLLGWFEVEFRGSPANPATRLVKLSTGPEVGETHWGQQQFPLYPALSVRKGDQVRGHLRVLRRPSNHRMITVEIDYAQYRDGEVFAPEVKGRFSVD